VGDRFIAGWDAFDRRAPAAARNLIARLTADVGPLVQALGELPVAGLHGDLKLANVALLPDADVGLIDWQMTLRAPVAVELGWLVVSNVALLPEPPDAVLDRYRQATQDGVGGWDAQVDLTWIVGLLLRGWRKALDAEANAATGWGGSGSDDLAWWCARAVEAADRRL
jgi:aminoglycoside phosphotransferase (APT) family kinase protein